MTDDKQEPSVVAWVWRMRVRLNSVSDWGSWSEWGIGKHNCTDTDYAQYEEQQVSLTSDLTAMKAELEEAKKALNEIACFTQTDKLLWWQERARAALSKPKPHDETRGRG